MKQTTLRLPDELARQAEMVARVRGTSVNALIIDALTAELARAASDKQFTSKARLILKGDKDALKRLAR